MKPHNFCALFRICQGKGFQIDAHMQLHFFACYGRNRFGDRVLGFEGNSMVEPFGKLARHFYQSALLMALTRRS